MIYCNKGQSRLLLYAMCVFVASLPFYGYSFLNVAGRGLLRPDWMGVVLVIAVFGLRFLLNAETVRVGRLGFAVLAFNAVALLSITPPLLEGAPSLADFFSKYAQVLMLSVFFFCFSSARLEPTSLKRIARVWILVAVVVAVYGIYQSFARNLDLPFAYNSITNPTMGMEQGIASTGSKAGSYARPSSFFSEPSYLASYLLGPIFFMLYLLLNRDGKFYIFGRRQSWLALGIMTLAFVLAFSLAGFMVALLLAPVLVVQGRLRINLKAIGLAAALVLVIALASGFTGFASYFERIPNELLRVIGDPHSVAGSSSGIRLARAQATLGVGLDNPVLGVGINMYPGYMEEYIPSWFDIDWPINIAHGMWITAFAEMGLPGLILLLLLWLAPAPFLYRAMRHRMGLGGELPTLCGGLYFVLLAEIIRGLGSGGYTQTFRWFYLA
ncbi:MAG TPA: O-antigen ligase domain-containing protein, partial [Nitrospirae bacterium]|nr:O-antigen ligase domain-containing protein [Nitrospirota bacterium]